MLLSRVTYIYILNHIYLVGYCFEHGVSISVILRTHGLLNIPNYRIGQLKTSTTVLIEVSDPGKAEQTTE